MSSTTITGKKGLRNAIAGFALFGALTVPGIALAAPGSADSGTANDYYNNPGYIRTACSASRCPDSVNGPGWGAPGAGAGAFQYFGKDNSLAGGANGPQTGLNNSSLAGNNPGNGGITQETPRDHPAPQNGG